MKTLVIRLSAIGDIVLTSPVIRCLATKTDTEVRFGTKAIHAAIPAQHPHIATVIALGKAPVTAVPGVVYCAQMGDLIRYLKKENYDLVVDLHHNLRTFRLKLALGVKAYSFPKYNFYKWLLVRFKINLMPDKHIVDRYMATVSPLGVVNDGRGLDFYLPPETPRQVDQFLGLHFPHVLHSSFTAFVIGATHFTKRFPVEKIIDTCRRISGPVILLGGKAEQEAGEQVARATGETVVNLCGVLSLFESAEIVRRATIVITNDTGLMHIAAAYHKKIIVVWGNTVPAFGMGPYYPTGKNEAQFIEVEALPCRPCSKIGFEQCPHGHFKCMNHIDIEKIVQQIAL